MVIIYGTIIALLVDVYIITETHHFFMGKPTINETFVTFPYIGRIFVQSALELFLAICWEEYTRPTDEVKYFSGRWLNHQPDKFHRLSIYYPYYNHI